MREHICFLLGTSPPRSGHGHLAGARQWPAQAQRGLFSCASSLVVPHALHVMRESGKATPLCCNLYKMCIAVFLRARLLAVTSCLKEGAFLCCVPQESCPACHPKHSENYSTNGNLRRLLVRTITSEACALSHRGCKWMARNLLLVHSHRRSLPATAYDFFFSRSIATDPLGVETSAERAKGGMPFMHGNALQGSYLAACSSWENGHGMARHREGLLLQEPT